MRKTYIFQGCAVSVVLMLLGCAKALGDQPVSLIPRPAVVEVKDGRFELNRRTRIEYDFARKELRPSAEYLRSQLHIVTGFPLPVVDSRKKVKSNVILLELSHKRNFNLEGYELEVQKNAVRAQASALPGLFYAFQSLLQLLPAEVSDSGIREIQKVLPCVSIIDTPRFSWRGMHLDVGRHFFPKEFVKTYIDMLAMHKMNTLHLHLTEDQGWRIEIRKYPRLTQVGSCRNGTIIGRYPGTGNDSIRYCGYYSQQDIKELVEYAARRSITIVPEIEMPGHSSAALASYPELGCTGGPYAAPTTWGVFDDVYCAGNDTVFQFLEDVLDEVMALFPSKFIHIGGDECPKERWKACPKCQKRIKEEGLKDEHELQSYFIRRIEKYLNSKGRRLIGWDEILEGGLAQNATVMSWRGEEGGIAAARQNHDVVMTPGSYCYFDHYQGPRSLEPLAIGGYTTVSNVYSYEPVPESLTTEQARHVLGAQANVWTEYISSPREVEYMVLPRMAAMAEVLWSPKAGRDWDEFAKRLAVQMKRYENAGYNYAKSAYLVSIAAVADSARKQVKVSMSTEMPLVEIHHTLDGTPPTASSELYDHPFGVEKSSDIRAASFRGGVRVEKVSEQKVAVHKAIFKPVKLAYPYERYDGGGTFGLVDGIRGTESYNDGKWQGFHQMDFVAVIDLGKPTPVSQIKAGFLQDVGSWIFYPKSVEYAISSDDSSFMTVGTFEVPAATKIVEPTIGEFTKEFPLAEARYVRVCATNVGVCPDWHPGKGEEAWLFIDEIVVE